MFIDKYPSDSAHELNLDWLIANMIHLISVYDKLPKELQKFVDEWLNAHPEATTTVQDGSLTPQKLLANEPSNGDVLSFNGTGFEWVDSELKGEWKIVQVDLIQRSACTLLINASGEYIIIDFGRSGDDTTILSAISDNGGLICKGCIISHFHFDHYGSYPQVLTAITKADDFKAYIPSRPLNDARYDDGGANVQNVWDTFIQFCQQNNIDVVIPADFIDYEIMGLPLKFYNCDVSWAYADPTVTELYNNTSLCCSIQMGTNVFGCWGDIYYEAEKHIIDNLSICNNTIMLAPHHGYGVRINRSFIEKLSPNVILTNVGSGSTATDELFYSSNVRQYADENVKPVLDVTDGTIVLDVDAKGKFTTRTVPVYYPQVIRNYPSMRNAISLRNELVTNDSDTGIKDLLIRMEPNSEINMYVSSSYDVATDLGLTNNAFVHIIKTTGGSTNNLWNRTTPSNFYFVIEVNEGVGNTQTRSIIGQYAGGVWRVRQGATQTYKANFAVAQSGNFSGIQLNTGFDLSVNGTLGVPMTGNYIIHIYNSTSTAQATLQIDGSDVGYSVYSHSSNFTVINLSAGSHTINTVNQSLRVMIEYVPNSNELDLSVFA